MNRITPSNRVRPIAVLLGVLSVVLVSSAASLSDYPRHSGEADDTLRILRAIAANPSGVVSFPAGEYRVSKPLVVSNLCSLDLDKSAILRATAEMPFVVKIAVHHIFGKLEKTSDRRQDYNLFVRGGKIDGNGLASCLAVDGACHFTLRDLTLLNGRCFGLRVDGEATGYEVIAQNLYFKCVLPGLAGNIALLTTGGDSHFIDCISVNYTVGIKIQNGGGANRVTRCHVWGSEKEYLANSVAFWIENSHGNILRDCYADTAQVGFWVNGSYNRLLGCSYHNNRRFGLDDITVVKHPAGQLLIADGNFSEPSAHYRLYDGCGTVKWSNMMYPGVAAGRQRPGAIEFETLK